MSRIGKKPVPLPGGVQASIADGVIEVKGPKGVLSMPLANDIVYAIDGNEIRVIPANDT